MVYFKKPKDFVPRFEAVSCYIEHSGKILLLKRQPHKFQGEKWGPPAGKIEKNESPCEAIRREVMEETGIDIPIDLFALVIKSYVVQSQHNFVWYMFRVPILREKIKLRKDEHSNYVWAESTEALSLDLALDEDQCIKKVFNLSKEMQSMKQSFHEVINLKAR